jgi:hypothetical protein
MWFPGYRDERPAGRRGDHRLGSLGDDGRRSRLALCAKPSLCEGHVLRLRFLSAASRPIPLRLRARAGVFRVGFGGSFDSARMECMHRWEEMWPRSAQDDIRVLRSASAGGPEAARKALRATSFSTG